MEEQELQELRRNIHTWSIYIGLAYAALTIAQVWIAYKTSQIDN